MHVLTRWSRQKLLFSHFLVPFDQTKGGCSIFWEDEDERFVGGVGVGLSCMQCSHDYIQSRPASTHTTVYLEKNQFNMFLQGMSLTRKQHKKYFRFIIKLQSYISSHPGRFYEFFTTMQWPPYNCAFLKSLLKKLFKSISPIIYPERISTRIPRKTALAKCFSALHLCACCSAYQTDKLSRPPRYLAQTARASRSSSASISLSVTACLFIQLELFESLELPWCVSVPAGRDLCVQCLLFFPNCDSFRAPQWFLSAVQTYLRRTQTPC